MRALLITVLLMFCGCALKQIEDRGYSFDITDYKSLKEGMSSKDTVIATMGHPTFTSNLDGQEIWVYFSEKTSKILFFKPKILERKIMTINFSKDNLAKEIRFFNLSDQGKVKFLKDYTAVLGPKKNLWQRIFGNIGRINPS